MKEKLNIAHFIYFDLSIMIIIISALIYSLIPNSFTIFPFNFEQKIIGINKINNIFLGLHYVFIGIGIVFITQSVTILFQYKINNIKELTIIKLLLYKWMILSLNTTIPYLLNIYIPTIFLILSVLIFFLLWYISMSIESKK